MDEHVAHRPGQPGETHHDEPHDDGAQRPGGGNGEGIRDAASLWDERYRSKPQIWSGKPNPQLVRETGGLPPGKALELGCGEGADAIWLAEHGWTVTAVDVSAVALERAKGHERAALARESVHQGGEVIAGRIRWQQADLERWQPEDAYDLVTSQFLHSQDLAWQLPLRAAAAAVKPGGTLLVVGHHPDRLPPWGGAHTTPGMFYSGEQLVQELGLDGPEWHLELSTSRERPVTGPDGQDFVTADIVVRASRRS